MDAPLRKFTVHRPKHKRSLHGIKFSNPMRYIHDSHILYTLMQRPFDDGRVVAVQTKVRCKGHDWHFTKVGNVFLCPHMQKKEISIEGVDPLLLLGPENTNWRILKSAFPKLHLITRGDTVFAQGSNGGCGAV